MCVSAAPPMMMMMMCRDVFPPGLPGDPTFRTRQLHQSSSLPPLISSSDFALTKREVTPPTPPLLRRLLSSSSSSSRLTHHPPPVPPPAPMDAFPLGGGPELDTPPPSAPAALVWPLASLNSPGVRPMLSSRLLIFHP